MRLLVLGGTEFLGRALVEYALDRGHEVTLFNRGVTNPELFPEAAKLRGDRTLDVSALEGGEWDAVLDLSTDLPRAVRLSVQELGNRVGRYLYVSSISAYADLSLPPTEDTPIAELADPESERPQDYGARKAACEQIVRDEYGDRALVVRPGLIVGPHDASDRFTYWPRRIAAGGAVLAPAPAHAPVQVIDVRDLGEWLVRAVEDDLSGTFNATGEQTTFGDVLDGCLRIIPGAEIVWVEPGWLLTEGVGEWMELPLWIASAQYAGMLRIDASKAVGAGLRFRPLAQTIADTLAWDEARETPRADGVGLTPDRERELLARA